jgi:hypothetical protein
MWYSYDLGKWRLLGTKVVDYSLWLYVIVLVDSYYLENPRIYLVAVYLLFEIWK